MKRIALPLLLLAAPGALAAQSTEVSSFVGVDGGVEGQPAMMGLTVGREARYFGLRWSAAMDAGSVLGTRSADGVGADGVLTTEVDALLLPLAWAGELAFTPYALAGGGVRMVRHPDGGSGAVWSYGAGLRTPIGMGLELTGEARHRSPLPANSSTFSATRSGWEFRAGIGVRFGGVAPALPRPRAPAYRVSAPAAAPATSAARHRVTTRLIDSGNELLGIRYRWGGNTPQQGFDCSGFVRYIFAREGIHLPRVSRDQARAGVPLPLNPAAFLPGDLLAFSSRGGEVDHIAIYVGDGRILHSSSSGRGVRYDDFLGEDGRWYREHLVAARRVIPATVALQGEGR